MAPLPKRKHSSQRQGKRRHPLKLHLPRSVKCSHCGAAKLPHFLCPDCHKP